MYACTSLNFQDLIDNRKKCQGIEFLVNGQYIVVIGLRDMFIITNHAGKRVLEQNQVKNIAMYNQSYLYIPRYSWTVLRNVYCCNKNDKVRYRSYIQSAHVLMINYSQYFTDPRKYFIPLTIVIEHLKWLIGDDHLLYLFMILKLSLVKDIIVYIFDMILYHKTWLPI